LVLIDVACLFVWRECFRCYRRQRHFGYQIYFIPNSSGIVNKTQYLKQFAILYSFTGVGKSFMAAALGHQACILGFKIVYFNCSKLFPNLLLFKANGTYIKQINKIQKQDVFVLDNIGLQKLEIQSRLAFLEILSGRILREKTDMKLDQQLLSHN
jgi:hypothetical protein